MFLYFICIYIQTLGTTPGASMEHHKELMPERGNEEQEVIARQQTNTLKIQSKTPRKVDQTAAQPDAK